MKIVGELFTYFISVLLKCSEMQAIKWGSLLEDVDKTLRWRLRLQVVDSSSWPIHIILLILSSFCTCFFSLGAILRLLIFHLFTAIQRFEFFECFCTLIIFTDTKLKYQIATNNFSYYPKLQKVICTNFLHRIRTRFRFPFLPYRRLRDMDII